MPPQGLHHIALALQTLSATGPRLCAPPPFACHPPPTRPPLASTPQDIFYEKADALVGVARDGDLACSRTFTFDLNRFEAPDQEETGV